MQMKKYKTGMILFPDLTIQDFVGPYDVFIRAECFEVFIISETKDLIKAEGGLTLQADYTLAECPLLDIIFVPGGRGINALLTNKEYLDFLKVQGAHAEYVTSVCTGSLVLAAAGLLKGYKATTHWRSYALLKMFGVEVNEDRIVVDRNKITGGGITAGIDFGLVLTSIIGGEDMAKTIQLMLEYEPAPPFHCGAPSSADAHIVEKATQLSQPMFDTRVKIIKDILKTKA
jgi:cyclohexyl-isocyanide hydratase